MAEQSTLRNQRLSLAPAPASSARATLSATPRWLIAAALLTASCDSKDPLVSNPDSGNDAGTGGGGTGGATGTGGDASGGTSTGGTSGATGTGGATPSGGNGGTGGGTSSGGRGTGGVSGSGGATGTGGTGGALGMCSAASSCVAPLVCERHDGPVCADPSWAAWPMPNDATSGAPNVASYTDNGDDTITDNVTGLVWQKTASRAFVWNDAVPYCSTLTLAGQNWRLPTRIELISIVDLSHRASGASGSLPAIDPVFGTTAPKPFWSSSTFADDPEFYAWLVAFNEGIPQTAEKVTMGYARCVR